MVPDSEPVSAFAAYSQGLTARAKKRKKSKKSKKTVAAANEESQNKSSPLKSKKELKKAALQQKKFGKIKTVAAPISTKSISKKQLPVSQSLMAELSSKKRKRTKKNKTNNEPVKSFSKKISAGVVLKKKPGQSFNLANDSLDLAFHNSQKAITTSTPAKAEVFEMDSSELSDEVGVTEQVDSYITSLEETKLFTMKRKKILSHKLETVKGRGLDAQGSEVIGENALEKMIAPMKIKDFMKTYWEKQLLHIPATDPAKFSKLLSTQTMDKVLRNEVLWFGRDLDITTYADGEKQNHNIEGARAQAHVVWDYYSNGCSIRLLHPHTHSKPLLVLMSALQEYFGSLVGANSYLTPPSSQGFAPHYDDIEAFILQLEGKKRWKVYKPRTKNDVLPRYSSPNFSEADMTEPPVFDAILSPGDLLYFPRGYIHQAHTLHNEHSLHATISVYQKNAWCDLMEKLIPDALQRAITNDVEFRRGLPINYLRHAGRFTSGDPAGRKYLLHTAKSLMSKLVSHIDIDFAVDELGVQFMHDALPPVLSPAEASCSVIGNGWRMEGAGKLRNKIDFPPNTRIRLTRANCYRLIEENVKGPSGESSSQISLYYTLDNSKLYHGEEPNFLVVEPEMLDTMKALVNAYPQFVSMSSLPCDNEDKIYGFVCNLWDYGLLVTDVPPESIDDLTTTAIAGPSDASFQTGEGSSSESKDEIPSESDSE